jgi:hypothetical protein
MNVVWIVFAFIGSRNQLGLLSAALAAFGTCFTISISALRFERLFPASFASNPNSLYFCKRGVYFVKNAFPFFKCSMILPEFFRGFFVRAEDLHLTID